MTASHLLPSAAAGRDAGAAPMVSLRVAGVPDPAVWAARHVAGQVPDASPYGLHRLADHGLVLDPTPAPGPGGPLAQRVERSLRHRGAGWEWWSGALRQVPPGVDVVACWDERTGIPALTGRRAPAVATGVIWLTDSPPAPALARVARWALRHAAAVWVLSRAQRGPLVEEWDVPASRLHHVPFGIDEVFWSRDAAAPDAPANAGPPVVLGVGNDRHRDHDGLVAAVAGLPARLSLVTALPVEVPPAVGERVAALDHVDLRERYAAAAVVAVLLRPNRHASGVTTVLEAQAMGRPLVLTDTPGLRDYVEPGVTADLVPVGDVDAARAAIARLLADPARGAAMGAAGRGFVLRHGRSADTAAALAGILRSV